MTFWPNLPVFCKYFRLTRLYDAHGAVSLLLFIQRFVCQFLANIYGESTAAARECDMPRIRPSSNQQGPRREIRRNYGSQSCRFAICIANLYHPADARYGQWRRAGICRMQGHQCCRKWHCQRHAGRLRTAAAAGECHSVTVQRHHVCRRLVTRNGRRTRAVLPHGRQWDFCCWDGRKCFGWHSGILSPM